MSDSLERDLETQLERLGFELVELERAGSRSKPVLRLRIDLPDSQPGRGVSLDDCRSVSRSLEAYLEERAEVPERYVLEVSSPGVERPLVRERDFERFAGREIAIVGHRAVHGHHKRIEGELVGLDSSAGPETIRVRLKGGEEVRIPRSQAKRVHLVFRWSGEGSEA